MTSWGTGTGNRDGEQERGTGAASRSEEEAMRVMDGRAQLEMSFVEWIAANIADQARKMEEAIDRKSVV